MTLSQGHLMKYEYNNTALYSNHLWHLTSQIYHRVPELMISLKVDLLTGYQPIALLLSNQVFINIKRPINTFLISGLLSS